MRTWGQVAKDNQLVLRAMADDAAGVERALAQGANINALHKVHFV